MELSEVVNPHFAFPVVGVVLCAVLVFAFGFKSPVQPPSFDGIEEDRKPRKSKHKKKPHSTEHLENHTGEKPTASHKQSTNIRTPAAASKPAATADKSPYHQKDNKSKTKKSPVQKPLVSDAEVIRESTQDNDDGWETVSVSKKKKRNKKEQDAELACLAEKPPSRALGVHNEPASVMEPSLVTKPAKIAEPDSVTEPALIEEVPEKIVSSDVKPQPQRTKHEKSGKTKSTDAAKMIDLSDKENTPEPDMQVKQQIEEKPSGQSVKSEKKVKKTKTTEEHQLLEIQSTQSPGGSTKEKKSKTKKTTNKKEHTPQKEVPTSAASAAPKPNVARSVSPGSKSSKGQKNKKDKQKREVSPPPVQETNSIQQVTTSSDIITKAKSDIYSSSQSTLSSAQESKKQVTAASSLSGTDTEPAPDKAGDTAVGNVTFDELGDWQEAKPSKKRKSKVRRDN